MIQKNQEGTTTTGLSPSKGEAPLPAASSLNSNVTTAPATRRDQCGYFPIQKETAQKLVDKLDKDLNSDDSYIQYQAVRSILGAAEHNRKLRADEDQRERLDRGAPTQIVRSDENFQAEIAVIEASLSPRESD